MPLHKIVKDILNSNSTSEEKRRELNEIKAAIELAEKIFSGELTYCKKCGDYYLAAAFLQIRKLLMNEYVYILIQSIVVVMNMKPKKFAIPIKFVLKDVSIRSIGRKTRGIN